MLPSALLPYHVQLIYQYIVPPSELSSPVPSHLLSRALLQRHVFLELAPTSPATYLSWDPAARDRVVALLDGLSKYHTDDLHRPLPVAYQVDEENAFAHVHLTSTGQDGVRLVFDWDDGDRSWKYHDAGLMPFPPKSHSTLDQALAATNALSDSSPDEDPIGPESPSDQPEDDGDDDYWNSYGAPDEDTDSPFSKVVIAADEYGSDGEDAYWAQYTSVQGAAAIISY
jgi:hypothetical protein